MKSRWTVSLLGGLCTCTSYGLAMYAMAFIPIALVAALRETSVIFGTIIAAVFLHERFGPIRYVAAGLVTVGAVAMKAL
jgi:drug/metabolite transporter (DMT)-like permease